MTPHRAVAAVEDLLRRDVTSAAVMNFEAEKWLTGVRVKDRSCFFEDVTHAQKPSFAASNATMPRPLPHSQKRFPGASLLRRIARSAS